MQSGMLLINKHESTVVLNGLMLWTFIPSFPANQRQAMPTTVSTSSAIAIPSGCFGRMMAKLPAYKALPLHYTPSVAWKLAAEPIADLLERTILQNWRAGDVTILQEWKDTWLCLLVKPSKQGRRPADYRPIGLTDPVGKTLLGSIKQQYEPELYAAIAELPQFACAAYGGNSCMVFWG